MKPYGKKNEQELFFFFFFFEREFQFMVFTPNDSSLLLDQTPISFWCRRELNPKSFIQPSETLLMELTGTHE